jgi:hypothetical protein
VVVFAGDPVGDAALDPAGYLGSATAFTDAALAAHRELEARLNGVTGPPPQ